MRILLGVWALGLWHCGSDPLPVRAPGAPGCPRHSSLAQGACDPSVNDALCAYTCYAEGRYGEFDYRAFCDEDTRRWRASTDQSANACGATAEPRTLPCGASSCYGSAQVCVVASGGALAGEIAACWGFPTVCSDPSVTDVCACLRRELGLTSCEHVAQGYTARVALP